MEVIIFALHDHTISSLYEENLTSHVFTSKKRVKLCCRMYVQIIHYRVKSLLYLFKINSLETFRATTCTLY